MLDVARRCPLQGEIVPQNCALNATAGMHAHKTKILNLLPLDSAGDGDHWDEWWLLFTRSGPLPAAGMSQTYGDPN